MRRRIPPAHVEVARTAQPLHRMRLGSRSASASSARCASSVRAMSVSSTRTTSSLMPSPRPRRARRRPVDERLELLVVVRQRLGEREEPPDGVLGAAEAHLDPPGLDRHAVGQAGQARLARRAGHRDPDPGEPRLAELGHQARAPLLLAAERGPLPVLPQKCMQRAIHNHQGDVYDPFVGSGTTVIAGEQEGRIVYAIEIEPAYVDVTVKRWEAFTGQKAQR